jgi:hypothetical protein
MLYIGLDNGVSGSIAILDAFGSILKFAKMPVKEDLNYTKTVGHIHRIDVDALQDFLSFLVIKHDHTLVVGDVQKKVMLERPMINPMRFQASMSAIRALEATLIVLEKLQLPYEYIDSKEWQRALLPAGIYKNKVDKAGRNHMKADPKELKKASKEIAKRIFPSADLDGFDDGDALLIAEYLRRKEKGILK